MTQEQKRIKLAEAAGWNIDQDGFLRRPDGSPAAGYYKESQLKLALKQNLWAIPDYLNDLNAIHKAVMSLPQNIWDNCNHHEHLHQ